eukprot:1676661-Rhodomonas_salina.1
MATADTDPGQSSPFGRRKSSTECMPATGDELYSSVQNTAANRNGDGNGNGSHSFRGLTARVRSEGALEQPRPASPSFSATGLKSAFKRKICSDDVLDVPASRTSSALDLSLIHI